MCYNQFHVFYQTHPPQKKTQSSDRHWLKVVIYKALHEWNKRLVIWGLLSDSNSIALVCILACVTLPCAPLGLQGGARSRQVHQLKQGPHVGCGLPTLFNFTDITNSIVEPDFKASRWVLGESLKFNTANWLAFPLKYEVLDKYNASVTKKKRTLNCQVWVNKINNNIL